MESKHICASCKHEKICIHREACMNLKSHTVTMLDAESPFSITIKCRHFEQKYESCYKKPGYIPKSDMDFVKEN